MPGSAPRIKLQQAVKSQLVLLAVQYVAGMAINVLEPPEEATRGLPQILSGLSLGIHAIVALGLVGGAVVVSHRLRREPKLAGLRSWDLAAGLSVGLAIIAGGLSLGEQAPELWSYVMACGALAAATSYGRIYVYLNQR